MAKGVRQYAYEALHWPVLRWGVSVYARLYSEPGFRRWLDCDRGLPYRDELRRERYEEARERRKKEGSPYDVQRRLVAVYGRYAVKHHARNIIPNTGPNRAQRRSDARTHPEFKAKEERLRLSAA